jgi:hypothetical protein
MGTKTTFVCDYCLREADNNLGWACVSVNGASDGKHSCRTTTEIFAKSVGARCRD